MPVLSKLGKLHRNVNPKYHSLRPGKRTWWFVVFLVCTIALPGTSKAREIPLEGMGEIGGGIFLPTGEDSDVARKSPTLQLAASVGFSRHTGIEAEFLYVPVLLKSTALTSSAHRKGTQLSLLGGLRFTSDRFLDNPKPVTGYLSLRAGFARITIRSDSAVPSGGWIGRPIDEIENPDAGFGVTQKIHQKGLVLSPKAGVLFRLSHRTALDVAFQPLFIFDRGDVNTQFFLILSIARSAWQGF